MLSETTTRRARLRADISPAPSRVKMFQSAHRANMKNWIIGVLVIALWGCANTGGPRVDNIPMYGQPELPRPDFMKKADEAFIRDAVKLFNGSRELASRAWAKEADRFFRNGDLDYAMRRYNQAWLLDQKNYLPYWGFGQVMMVQEKYDDAIKFYEEAKLLIDENYKKPALYTDLGIAYSFKAMRIQGADDTRKRYFDAANHYFQQSSELDRKYPVVWEAWANSLYSQQRYAEAWEKVRTAKEMGRVLQPRFLERLRSVMPEPEK